MEQIQKHQSSKSLGSARNRNGKADNAESSVIGRVTSNTSHSRESRSTIVILADHDDNPQQSRPKSNDSYQPQSSSSNNQCK